MQQPSINNASVASGARREDPSRHLLNYGQTNWANEQQCLNGPPLSRGVPCQPYVFSSRVKRAEPQRRADAWGPDNGMGESMGFLNPFLPLHSVIMIEWTRAWAFMTAYTLAVCYRALKQLNDTQKVVWAPWWNPPYCVERCVLCRVVYWIVVICCVVLCLAKHQAVELGGKDISRSP